LRCASGSSESESADRYPVPDREEIASVDRRHMSRSKIRFVDDDVPIAGLLIRVS